MCGNHRQHHGAENQPSNHEAECCGACRSSELTLDELRRRRDELDREIAIRAGSRPGSELRTVNSSV